MIAVTQTTFEACSPSCCNFGISSAQVHIQGAGFHSLSVARVQCGDEVSLPHLLQWIQCFVVFLLSRKVIRHPATFVGNLGASMPRCFCPQSVNSKAWSKEGGLAFAPWKSQNPGLFPMQTFMIEKERNPSLLVCLFPTCQTLLLTLDYVTAAGHCFWFRL